jgi:serine protease Do
MMQPRMFAAIIVSSVAVLNGASEEIHADDFSTEEVAAVEQAEADRIATIERVYGSVVAVFGLNRQGGGSGVIFDHCGWALTNHHVVAAAGNEGWAGLADGKLYRWKLIGTDPGGDLAIIRLTGKDEFPTAPLGDSEKLQLGDIVFAMGNPFTLAEDYTPTVTMGIVSGLKRYQYGATKTTLVYGNCIQVDSSISPGNSGGPLFNSAGQVVGINGRAGFGERGRINVGVGFAISGRQIANFIPDLLATKLAEHGTLDAQFGNRTDGVICQAINLDSAAALTGLKLGDRMLSFEGQRIENANELTNLVSTLPAHWPVTTKCQRDGRPYNFTTRLAPLPYDQRKQPAVETDPEPKEEQPKHATPDGDAPEKTPKRKVIETGRPQLQLGEQGAIRDMQVNAEAVEILLSRLREHSHEGELAAARPITLEDEIVREGRKVGEQTIEFSGDGRFRLDLEFLERKVAYGFDGEEYWKQVKDESRETLPVDEMLDDPFAMQALLINVVHFTPRERLGEFVLEGSDKAVGRPAFRLKVTDESGREFFVWLSVVDQRGQFHVELLKAGRSRDGHRRAVTFSDWQARDSRRFPAVRAIVNGLGESLQFEIVSRSHGATENATPERTSNAFSVAVVHAQTRTVKLTGAGIGRQAGYASGVSVSAQGHILTADGVYLGGDRLRVTLPDGSVHRAQVERTCPPLQAALIKIDASTPDFFDLTGAPPTVEKGDLVLTIGNAFKVADGKEPLSVSLGVVSLRTELETKRGVSDIPYRGDALLIDAITSNPGVPGGAVVDTQGKLVAMVGRILEGKDTQTRLNYAVPADQLARFLAGETFTEVADVKPVGDSKPELGIRLYRLGGAKSPCYIDRIVPGSPAEKAGLKPDDLVLSIGGETVRDIRGYDDALGSLRPGVETTLVVKRKQQLLNLTLTPTAAP